MKKYISLFLMFFALCGCNESNAKSDEKVDQLSTESSAVQAQKTCPDVMKYQVGDYVFGIDRFKGRVQAYEKSKGGGYTKLPDCRKGIQSVQKIRYEPYQFFDRDGVTNKAPVITIEIVYDDTSTEQLLEPHEIEYPPNWIKENLVNTGVELEDLSLVDEFYKFEFKKNQFVFFAKQDGIKTRLGKPLTFFCLPSSYDHKVLVCKTFFLWKENIGIRLVRGSVIGGKNNKTPADWPLLYEQLQEFAQNLLIKTTEAGG